MKQTITKKQAEVFGVILRQLFLLVGQCEDGISKVGFAVIANRVDVPYFCCVICAILFRRDGTYFPCPTETVKVRKTSTQDLLHIGKGDGGKVQFFRRAVLRDEEVGVVDRVPLIGIDYFIVVSIGPGKITGDAFLHILNTFSENLVDCKGGLVHVFRNSRIVIENRLSGCSGCSAIRQASEGKPRQEQNKKQRQRQ